MIATAAAVAPARCGRCSYRCCVSSPSTPATPTSCANRSSTGGATDTAGRHNEPGTVSGYHESGDR